MKEMLKKEWDDGYWAQTLNLRQNDAKKLSIVSFLANWPKMTKIEAVFSE